MAYDDQDILAILDGQSEGYLIHPDASAFIAAGFTVRDEVEAALLRLAEAGHVQEFEDVEHEPVLVPVLKPQVDADGNIKTNKKGAQLPYVPHVDPITGDPHMTHELDADGKHVTRPKLDADGNEIILNHGFEITAKGRKAAPPKPVPDEPESSP